MAGGYFARRALLARIEIINRTASAIVQGDLAHRVPVHDSADEFDQLAQTINRMLEQIQQVDRGGAQRFERGGARSAHAAGRGADTVGVILLRSRPPAATTFTEIEGTVDEIDRLIGTSTALLRLAEIDSGVRRSGFGRIDLAAEIAAGGNRPLSPHGRGEGDRPNGPSI